jgi:carboxymethylenebutenolidase
MRITLPSGTPAELARPDGAPSRGLVVVPDIMGLRPLFDEHVARLAAEQGWAVCAPEPFVGREDLPIEDRLEQVGSLDDTRVLGDLAEAADATGVDAVGVVGFCLGGMYVLKAATTGRFDRAVAFYGMIRLPEGWRSPTQAEPLELLDRGHCPTLAIVGTDDPYTPPDDVLALEAAGVSVVRYEGAEHGFVHDPSRPAHRPDDAADAWRRALAFLAGG